MKTVITNKCTFVFDRGYDAHVFFDYFLDKSIGDDFIIRLKETRNLLFKGKLKNVGEITKKRKGKGKIKMKMFFSSNDKDVHVSHTKEKDIDYFTFDDIVSVFKVKCKIPIIPRKVRYCFDKGGTMFDKRTESRKAYHKLMIVGVTRAEQVIFEQKKQLILKKCLFIHFISEQ